MPPVHIATCKISVFFRSIRTDSEKGIALVDMNFFLELCIHVGPLFATPRLLVQELHDLASTAELFVGDALCFASVTCLAAHLPYTLRAIALDRARDAVLRRGVPASQWWVREDDPQKDQADLAARTNKASSDGNVPEEAGAEGISARTTDFLALKRHRVGNFAAGVLTNLMQLQNWAVPSDTMAEGDGGDDSSEESDGGQFGGDGDHADAPGGKSVAAGMILPYHPAFLDAAMLTLCTPKWPLLWDPEGIALRQESSATRARF